MSTTAFFIKGGDKLLRQILQCNCGGEVKLLTETLGDSGTQSGNTTDSTEYYQCDKCKSIYQRRVEKEAYQDRTHYGEFEKYKGRFSAEQLQKYAPKTNGEVADHPSVLPWSHRQAWQDDES